MRDNDVRTSVGVWQGRLGLSGWHIAVIYSTDGLTVGDRRMFAKCERHEFFDKATFRFDPCVLNDDQDGLGDTIERDHINSGVLDWEEYIEVTIIHELLHMTMRSLMQVNEMVREQIGASAGAIWDAAWIRAEEEFCERTAQALYDSWPLVESGIA